jgi:hypothetical protein
MSLLAPSVVTQGYRRRQGGARTQAGPVWQLPVLARSGAQGAPHKRHASGHWADGARTGGRRTAGAARQAPHGRPVLGQTGAVAGGPLYDLAFAGHIVAAVLGFGAIGVSGWSASRARRLVDPLHDEVVRRFFRPGTDWPARAVFLVPVLGLVVLFGSDKAAVHEFWPWLGLGIWALAVVAALIAAWPAEKRAQAALAEAREGDFRVACYQLETAVGVISICFVAILLVMIIQ